MIDSETLKKTKAKAEIVKSLSRLRTELIRDVDRLLKLKAFLHEENRDCSLSLFMGLLDSFGRVPLDKKYKSYEDIWPLNKLNSTSRGRLLQDYNGLFGKLKQDLKDYYTLKRKLALSSGEA